MLKKTKLSSKLARKISRETTIYLAFFGFLLTPIGTKLAQARDYTFTKIANSNDGFEFFTVAPSVNDAGLVSFGASDNGEGGIFVGNGGFIETIVDSSGNLDFPSSPVPIFGIEGGLPSGPNINNLGNVTFLGFLDTGEQGVFKVVNDMLLTVVDGRSGSLNQFSTPVINNLNAIAFEAEASGPATGDGIYRESNGSLMPIIDDTGPFGTGDDAVSINDGGLVAFVSGLDTGEQGVFVGDGGVPTLIADSSGPFNIFFPVSVNNQGVVAFWSQLDNGSQGIFTGSDGLVTTIVDSSGLFEEFFSVSLNDLGELAFFGGLDDGSIGLFVGPDPVADKVITIGEDLLGSPVTQLFFSLFHDGGFNNKGQLTFWAEREDGTTGIYRADPLSVPEPSCLLGFLALGLGGAASAVKRN